MSGFSEDYHERCEMVLDLTRMCLHIFEGKWFHFGSLSWENVMRNLLCHVGRPVPQTSGPTCDCKTGHETVSVHFRCQMTWRVYEVQYALDGCIYVKSRDSSAIWLPTSRHKTRPGRKRKFIGQHFTEEVMSEWRWKKNKMRQSGRRQREGVWVSEWLDEWVKLSLHDGERM